MPIPIEIESLVATHEKPFVVIDSDFQIVAVNRVFEETYGVIGNDVIGRYCYEVSHGTSRPCYEQGEDCPHLQVFKTGQCHSCLHTHRDAEERLHQVRVTMHPLKGGDGRLYAGEMIDELSVLDERRIDKVCMVGRSPVFLRSVEQLKSAAQYDVPVLLQGETGTGKELAANFIHENSSRRDKPFLTLDCTVLTEALFESEVFGHDRGAFTGSVGEKKGLFELADGGTLFLDEVGEMSPNTQAKMLRVLESGEFRRVGGRDTLHADVRVICATNRKLKEAEWFRKDLFYRIACLSVQLPSLRDRIEDVPLLARSLLDRVGQSMQRINELMPGALNLLKQYSYPGNVRELRNILWAAATKSADGRIEAAHVMPLLSPALISRSEFSPQFPEFPVQLPSSSPEADTLEDVEAHFITQLLERVDGNRRRAAQEMGVSERTLYRKLKRLNLH